MTELLSKTRERKLRHGIKTWGAVPTAEDVDSLFAAVDHLRAVNAQLLEALEPLVVWAEDVMRGFRIRNPHYSNSDRQLLIVPAHAAIEATKGDA